jgi:hypothetical protein
MVRDPAALSATRGSFRCFRCFSRKLTAIGISFSAEILGRRRFEERKNSEAAAVLSLFSAVLCAKNARVAELA